MYWDLYLIENLFLDGTMLGLTLFLMRKKARFIRVLIAALLGAVTSTFMLVAGLQFGISYLLILFVMGMVMMGIAMEQKTKHELLLGMVYYFTLVFVFSKLLKGGEWIAKDRISKVIIAMVVIGIMSMALCYIIYQNQKNRKNTIYQVSMVEKGKRVDVKALYDTGNTLTEPFSGKPVSIVEREVWQKLIKEAEPERFKVIPFHSIGQEHGILKGLEIDELIIWTGERKIVQKQAVIALYEGCLSKDKSFHMILQQSLLNL